MSRSVGAARESRTRTVVAIVGFFKLLLGDFQVPGYNCALNYLRMRIYANITHVIQSPGLLRAQAGPTPLCGAQCSNYLVTAESLIEDKVFWNIFPITLACSNYRI